MSDIKLVQDAYGRYKPVKAEDLYEYGLSPDGRVKDAMKHKIFRIEQPKDDENVNSNYVMNKSFTPPLGSIIHSVKIFSVRAPTYEGSYVYLDEEDEYFADVTARFYLSWNGQVRISNVIFTGNTENNQDTVVPGAYSLDFPGAAVIDNPEYQVVSLQCYMTVESTSYVGGLFYVMVSYIDPQEVEIIDTDSSWHLD